MAGAVGLALLVVLPGSGRAAEPGPERLSEIAGTWAGTARACRLDVDRFEQRASALLKARAADAAAGAALLNSFRTAAGAG